MLSRTIYQKVVTAAIERLIADGKLEDLPFVLTGRVRPLRLQLYYRYTIAKHAQMTYDAFLRLGVQELNNQFTFEQVKEYDTSEYYLSVIAVQWMCKRMPKGGMGVLAREIGTAPSYFSQVLSELTKGSLEKLQAAANALGIEWANLLRLGKYIVNDYQLCHTDNDFAAIINEIVDNESAKVYILPPSEHTEMRVVASALSFLLRDTKYLEMPRICEAIGIHNTLLPELLKGETTRASITAHYKLATFFDMPLYEFYQTGLRNIDKPLLDIVAEKKKLLRQHKKRVSIACNFLFNLYGKGTKSRVSKLSGVDFGLISRVSTSSDEYTLSITAAHKIANVFALTYDNLITIGAMDTDKQRYAYCVEHIGIDFLKMNNEEAGVSNMPEMARLYDKSMRKDSEHRKESMHAIIDYVDNRHGKTTAHKWFADAHVSYTILSALRNPLSKHTPSVRTVRKLARSLGWSYDDIVKCGSELTTQGDNTQQNAQPAPFSKLSTFSKFIDI